MEDNIRPPDKVVKTRLFDYEDTNNNNNSNNNTTNYNLDTILEMSKLEYEKQIEQIEIDRQKMFPNIKLQLNKMVVFDKINSSFYALILSIITMYENSIINEYYISVEERTEIFKILKTIRLPSEEISNLKNIILCN
jgi:hypothetical protein